VENTNQPTQRTIRGEGVDWLVLAAFRCLAGAGERASSFTTKSFSHTPTTFQILAIPGLANNSKGNLCHRRIYIEYRYRYICSLCATSENPKRPLPHIHYAYLQLDPSTNRPRTHSEPAKGSERHAACNPVVAVDRRGGIVPRALKDGRDICSELSVVYSQQRLSDGAEESRDQPPSRVPN